MQELMLHAQLFASDLRLGPQVRTSMTLSRLESWMLTEALPGLVYRLEATVYGHAEPPQTVTEHTDVTFAIEVPATWWDQLKQGPHDSPMWRWIARRWPPRLRTVNQVKTATLTVQLTELVLFPENSRVFPAELGSPVPYYARENYWNIN